MRCKPHGLRPKKTQKIRLPGDQGVVLTYSFKMKMINNGLEKAADKLTLMFLTGKSELFENQVSFEFVSKSAAFLKHIHLGSEMS
jgi:hypothetical protein